MAALRLDLIGRYLRPHRRTVLLGAIALVVVNVLRAVSYTHLTLPTKRIV